jgi:hypothetical protein
MEAERARNRPQVAENVRLYIASAGEALIVNICEGNGRMRGVEGRWNGADSMQWAGGVWERRVGLFFAANKAVVVGQVRTAGESLLATFGFSRCGVWWLLPKPSHAKSNKPQIDSMHLTSSLKRLDRESRSPCIAPHLFNLQGSFYDPS